MTDALDPVLCAQLIHLAKPWRWSVKRPPVSMSIDEAVTKLATQLEAALAEIDRLAVNNLRLDKLSRCVTIGCGLGGRCDLAGLAEYPCPLAPRSRLAQLEDEISMLRAANDETQLSITELAEDILGPHPQSTPAEELKLVSAHDFQQQQHIAHLEVQIAWLASLFDADPSQPVDDDIASIERGIKRLTASQPNWAHSETLKQRDALEAELAAVREVSRVSIEVQRMRIVELEKSCAGSHLPEGAAEWLLQGERGLSSEAIFSHLTEIPLTRGHMVTPADPSDLRRCRRLLDQVPAFRAALPRMAEVSPRWKALIERWDEVCAMMDMETPNWRSWNGTAPRTADMLFRIERQVAHDSAEREVSR